MDNLRGEVYFSKKINCKGFKKSLGCHGSPKACCKFAHVRDCDYDTHSKSYNQINVTCVDLENLAKRNL